MIIDHKRIAKMVVNRETRICAHDSVDDRLHNMIVCHYADSPTYIHKHLGKAETVHIISGEMDVVYFDDEGRCTECVEMSNTGVFFLRIPADQWHTMVVQGPFVIFHESVSGPWKPEHTVKAPWEAV